MENLLDGVVKGYINGGPRVLVNRIDSIFHFMDLRDYRNLNPTELLKAIPVRPIMATLSSGCALAIRHAANTEFDSFQSALDAVAGRDQTLELQGTYRSLSYVLCPINVSRSVH